MTREETLMKVLKEKDEKDKIHYSKVYEIVNEIFNDFENRICKNCKWFKYDKIREDYKCFCNDVDNFIEYDNYCAYDAYFNPEPNFSCNKFERRAK